MGDLATYVVAWNGEPLEPGDFDALNLLRPDKKAIASIVVGLYETGDDVPKLRSGLLAHLASVRSSNSPDASASPSGDSSGGSRSSDTSTTPSTRTAASV